MRAAGGRGIHPTDDLVTASEPPSKITDGVVSELVAAPLPKGSRPGRLPWKADDPGRDGKCTTVRRPQPHAGKYSRAYFNELTCLQQRS